MLDEDVLEPEVLPPVAEPPPIGLIPKDQLEGHVTTLLDLTQLAEFHEPTQQAEAFLRMQTLWPHLTEQHKTRIRTRVCDALKIPEGRFHYLIEMQSATDLRLGLRWRRTPIKRDPSEKFYPGHEDGWLGRYLAYAEAGHAHLGYHYWAGLSVLGAAARRNFFMLEGEKRLFPNLYMLFEGDSGCGKNTAIDRARDLMKATNVALLRQTAEGSVIERVPTIGLLSSKMTPIRLFKGLKGCQKMVGPMRALERPDDFESCGLIAAPELATLLGEAQFGSSQLVSLFTQAYDGWMEDDTEKHGLIQLENICLSLLLGSTMSWLRDNMTDAIFQGGFMGARCLVISKKRSSRKFPIQPIVDPIQKMALADALSIYAQYPPTELYFSEQAYSYYHHWYMENDEQSDDDRINGYYARKSVYIKKLAMVLALSRRHIPEIATEDVESAINLLQHEEPGMLAAFRAMLASDESNLADWIYEILRQCGGQMPQADIVRRCKTRLSGAQVIDMLRSMEMAGLVAPRTMKRTVGPGGPLVVWYRTDMIGADGLRVL